jgi:phage gp45-like
MKRSDSIEYHISAHYLSALINGDITGLSDAEEIQLQDFEYQAQQDAPAGFEFGHFSYSPDYSEDFANCEVCGLQSQVVPVTAIYWSKSA